MKEPETPVGMTEKDEKRRLLAQALCKFSCGLIAMGALLFLPAGTFAYWNAWLLMGLLFVPMFTAGWILLRKAPELLRKRLKTDEKETEQRTVILLSSLMFAGGFAVASLDFRFGWSHLPAWVVAFAAICFLIAYGLYAEVLRENAYLSRVVEVQENQKVIDTGLYGVVRHPMYFATVLLFLSMPLILGSVWAFVLFLFYPFLLVKRIRNEEAVLRKDLPGYENYMRKVRYRLLPFVW